MLNKKEEVPFDDKKDSQEKNKVAERKVQQTLSMINASFSQGSQGIGSSLVEKMKPEQIPEFFKHIEAREKEANNHNFKRSIIFFIAFLCVLILFGMIIYLFKDISITKEIIIGIVSFIGGGGFGFGLSNKLSK